MLPKGNFLFVPDQDPVNGRLYELGPGDDNFRPDSFVLLPYSEPRLRKPAPRYFPILGQRHVQGFLRPEPASGITVNADTDKRSYIDNVLRLKEHIQRGNVYEVNYCLRFSAIAEIDPLSVFLRLCNISRAPYQMLARIGNDFILCASPELFLRKSGSTLITKPIKGTIRRGNNLSEDEALRNELQSSLKDRTENVMAVDVARNDLSMLATRGSVNVNKLYNIESFETVHQMVSTVSCELRADAGFEQIAEAAFPMASMTGAPKRSAMRLIGETETFERGYYSGTMGLIDEKGDFTLPVIIRSLFYNAEKKQLWFAVGGAITWLSEPDKEYEECLLKAAGILKALQAKLRSA